MSTRLRSSAVPAGRKVARVDRLLQEFFRGVLPELADGRVRVDHRVLQLAVHALDLAYVDVLDRAAVRIHHDGPARRILDLRPAQCVHERGPVLRPSPLMKTALVSRLIWATYGP